MGIPIPSLGFTFIVPNKRHWIPRSGTHRAIHRCCLWGRGEALTRCWLISSPFFFYMTFPCYVHFFHHGRIQRGAGGEIS
jgi:hypothetical protein